MAPKESSIRVSFSEEAQDGAQDQGDRRGRRRIERRQPHDSRQGRGRRIHRRQYRPAGAEAFAGAGEAAARREADEGAGRGRESRGRPQGGARGHGEDPRGAGRRGHGVRHVRPRRRHGQRRRAGGGESGERARRADRGGGHQAVRVRRQAAHAAGRAGACGTDRLRGHRHRDPQRAADGVRRAGHELLRGVPHRRRHPAPGRAGHLRHHHDPRDHQSRLRRREDDHVRPGLRGDGHGRRPRDRIAPSTPPTAPSTARCSKTIASTARRES